MPAVGTVLSQLVKTKMDTKFKTLASYSGPLAQQNPSYFHHFCEAIGNGIADGTPVINFQTNDSGMQGTPFVAGTGSGIGIVVDQEWFTENLYKNIRAIIVQNYGSSNHPEWNVEYNFLTALCESISEAITEHYTTAWTLTSAHPQIYGGSGVISNGMFSGISPISVKSAMMARGNLLLGSAWPLLCQAISDTYAEVIHTKSTGGVTIAGTCSPSQSQACGISGTGAGTGTAI